jgi:hypothetical protein
MTKKKKKKHQIDTNQVISLPTRLVAKTKFETCVGFDCLKKQTNFFVYSQESKSRYQIIQIK